MMERVWVCVCATCWIQTNTFVNWIVTCSSLFSRITEILQNNVDDEVYMSLYQKRMNITAGNCNDTRPLGKCYAVFYLSHNKFEFFHNRKLKIWEWNEGVKTDKFENSLVMANEQLHVQW